MKSKAAIIKEWKRGQEEIATLEMLATMERPLVAEKLGITYNALTSRIETMRLHAIRYEWYLKELKQLKKLSPYLVGLLAPQKPVTFDEDAFEL